MVTDIEHQPAARTAAAAPPPPPPADSPPPAATPPPAESPAPAGSPPPAGAPHRTGSFPPGWRQDLVSVARLGRDWLARPRVRLALAGLALLAIGALVLSSSVWTLPLVIAGVLMVITAWIGHRLEGRLALQWGQNGARLDFRATVKPAHEVPVKPAHEASAAVTPDAAAVSLSSGEQDADVIEGEAHTIEIDVAELKALIASAEAAEAPRAASVRDIRIRRAQAEAEADASV